MCEYSLSFSIFYCQCTLMLSIHLNDECWTGKSWKRKMQGIRIQLISEFMVLFLVFMLLFESCLHWWLRSQLVIGSQVFLIGLSFSNFSSGYTRYYIIVQHNLEIYFDYLIMHWSCFTNLFLGAILCWAGTLWEY